MLVRFAFPCRSSIFPNPPFFPPHENRLLALDTCSFLRRALRFDYVFKSLFPDANLRKTIFSLIRISNTCIYIAHSKKNQIIVDYRSVPLHLLLLPRTIRFETTAQPFRGNHGLSKGLAPPPPSSSWTPGFVADRREHQCRRRDLNSDYSLAPPREKGWTQPLVGFHKKKKKEKEGGTLLPFQIRGHEKMDRRPTGLELLAPSSRQLGTPRYAFVPLFTTLYSGLRFMRYHRSRPGPFHK